MQLIYLGLIWDRREGVERTLESRNPPTLLKFLVQENTIIWHTPYIQGGVGRVSKFYARATCDVTDNPYVG